MKKRINKVLCYLMATSIMFSSFTSTVFAETKETVNSNEVISEIDSTVNLNEAISQINSAVNSTITMPNGIEYAIVADETRPNNTISYVTSLNLTKITSPYNEQNTAEAIIVNNVVVGIGVPSKGTYVPHNGMAISGSGTMKEVVASLKFGDIVSTKSIVLPEIDANYIQYTGPLGESIRQDITGINKPRGAGETILYTPEFGESTKTNRWGTEITVVDGIITAISRQGTNQDKGTIIPKDGYVISINGKPERYNHLKVGDSITVQLKLPKYYSAEVVSYDAFNPKTKEDNPGGWDNANDKPYGGFRGTNQLIVYDKGYGQPSTGTNVWGAEITVDAETNKAVSANNGNSPILDGQYVLSGHGTKAAILRNLDIANVLVKINQQAKQITFISTPDMLIDTLNYKADKVIEACNHAKESLRDVDYAKLDGTVNELTEQKVRINDLQTYIDHLNFAELYKQADLITEIIHKSSYATIETLRVEKRSVWYRPTETNEDDVRITLQNMKDSGLNAIYIEAWIGGYPIWKSDVVKTPIYPSLNGFDALEAFTRIGKEMNIEVHAWVKTFFIGGFTNAPFEDTIAAQHPEWLLKSRDGSNKQHVSEYNCDFYFMNPMEPEARDLISDMYKEIVTKYEVSGVNFDYVRFPEAGGKCENGMLNDFGYNDNIVNAYKAKYGTDPFTIDQNHPEWKQWCHFRADLINTFVYRTSTELKSINKNLKLSAAVVPDYDVAPLTKYQETLDWVYKGYIDEIFTMSYYFAYEPVAFDAKISMERIKNMAYASTGISAQGGMPYDMILKQLQVIREQNAASSAVFTLKEMVDNGTHMKLREHLYRDDVLALPEDTKEAIPAILNEVLRKIDTIYTVYGGDSICSYPITEIKILLSTFAISDFSVIETKLYIASIERLLSCIEKANINPNAKERIITDLSRAKYLLTIHYSREKAMNEQIITDIYLEVPKDTVVGSKTKFRLRAVIDRGDYESEFYLNPNQYTITTNSNNIEFINNQEVIFKDNKQAKVIIKLTDEFKLKSKNLLKAYSIKANLSK